MERSKLPSMVEKKLDSVQPSYSTTTTNIFFPSDGVVSIALCPETSTFFSETVVGCSKCIYSVGNERSRNEVVRRDSPAGGLIRRGPVPG